MNTISSSAHALVPISGTLHDFLTGLGSEDILLCAKHILEITLIFLKAAEEDGEIDQGLRVLSALAEDPGLVSSTYAE